MKDRAAPGYTPVWGGTGSEWIAGDRRPAFPITIGKPVTIPIPKTNLQDPISSGIGEEGLAGMGTVFFPRNPRVLEISRQRFYCPGRYWVCINLAWIIHKIVAENTYLSENIIGAIQKSYGE